MQYQFPPDLDERVRARMTDGAYQSEDDLLREALDALDDRERQLLQRWHEGNRIAMEQSRQGLSKPLDLDRVMEQVTKRMAEHQSGS